MNETESVTCFDIDLNNLYCCECVFDKIILRLYILIKSSRFGFEIFLELRNLRAQ